MKKLIDELNKDHEIIGGKIDQLSELLREKAQTSFPKIFEVISFFGHFTFSEHHKREEHVLYKWMLEQNKNADSELIKVIINEHKELELLGKKIAENIQSHLESTPKVSVLTVESDVSYFIARYREHVEKEERFIFAIAEALSTRS